MKEVILKHLNELEQKEDADRQMTKIESPRIPKAKFNIFRVALLNDEPNYFIGSLIACFFLLIISPAVGIIFLIFDIQQEVAGGALIMPLFGFAVLGVGLKYFFDAKKTHSFGKQYLAEKVPKGLKFILYIQGKAIKFSIIGAGRSFFDNDGELIPKCEVIYDEKNQSKLLLKPRKHNLYDKLDHLDNLDHSELFLLEDKLIEEKLIKRDIKLELDKDSLKGIVGSDKKRNYIPVLFVLVCFEAIILTGIMLINFVFSINKDLLIAINVVCAFFCVLIGIYIIGNLFNFRHFRRLVKGSELLFGKVTGTDFVVENVADDNGPTTTYLVEYEVYINEYSVKRKSGYIYSGEDIKKIKKLKYFPVLYNEKYDNALYFSANYCRLLNDKIKKEAVDI